MLSKQIYIKSNKINKIMLFPRIFWLINFEVVPKCLSFICQCFHYNINLFNSFLLLFLFSICKVVGAVNIAKTMSFKLEILCFPIIIAFTPMTHVFFCFSFVTNFQKVEFFIPKKFLW